MSKITIANKKLKNYKKSAYRPGGNIYEISALQGEFKELYYRMTYITEYGRNEC